MSVAVLYPIRSKPDNRWLLWGASALVGAIFFYKGHNPTVSLDEFWTAWSHDGDAVATGGNALKGAALSFIAWMGLLFLAKSSGRRLNLVDPLAALMLFYVAWSTLSVTWSDDVGQAVRKWLVFLFCVVGAFGMAKQFSLRELAWFVMLVTGTYLAVGFLSELALGTFKPHASGYRFAGTVHPNSQGANLVLFCLSAFCLWRCEVRHRRWIAAAIVVGLMFLVLTKSRTSCAGLLAALGMIWLVGVPLRAKLATSVGIVFVGASVLLVVLLFGMDIVDEVTGTLMMGRQEESEALTGRLPIWTELSNYIVKRPLTGYGYESFWNPDRIEMISEELMWTFREAHSSYVDAMLSVGLIGTGTALLCVLIAIARAMNCYRVSGDMGDAFALGLLTYSLICAFSESGMMTPCFVTLVGGAAVAHLACVRQSCASN